MRGHVGEGALRYAMRKRGGGFGFAMEKRAARLSQRAALSD